MEKVRKKEKKILVMGASLVRRAWLNIILFLLAVAMIISGVYLGSQTHWVKRADINWYNEGLLVYSLPAELLPETDDRPEEYPVVRAAAYFQEAALESTDDGFKALALYNLGTLMGKDTLTIVSGGTARFAVAEAINKLAESVRIDPDNEDAKYNLELLEELQSMLTPATPPVIVPVSGFLGGGSGYSGGAVHKGY